MATKYEVNDEKQLVVTVGGKSECYELSEAMDENALLVVEEKRDILHQMDLPVVISNLDNTVELMNVAYHAVYGFPEYIQVFGLQKTVMDLNDEGIGVVTDFKDQATEVVAELVSVYRWLMKGIESMAVSKLERFANRAENMSRQAAKMSEGYKKAADRATEVLESVMKQNSVQIEKDGQLDRMVKELEASQKSVEAIQSSVEERLSALQQEYTRLTKVDDEERRHKRTMDIMGTVFSSLGAAVSVVSTVMNFAASSSQAGAPGEKGSQKDYDKAVKDEEDLRKAIEEKEEEICSLQEKLNSLAEQKDKAEGGEKEELEKAFESIQKKISEAKDAKESLAIRKKAAADTLAGLKEVLDAQGTQIRKDAAAGSDADQVRAEQMSTVYKEIMELQKKKTEQAGLLAKYTKQMETAVIDRNSIEAAIQSLILAISCLKKSVVALKDIALFWSSLDRSCRALSNRELKEDIEKLQSADKADRIKVYQSEDIMYPIASYMAKWVAILSVSRDYLTAAEKTRNRLNKTVADSDPVGMSKEDHWRLASRLAGEVGDRLAAQIADSGK